jgi:hypothetical protein
MEKRYDLGANVYIYTPLNYNNFTDATKQLALFLAVIEIPEVQ